MSKWVSPSILSADWARLGEEVKSICEAGADLIHVDVMDGMFVTNLTLGWGVVKAIKPYSTVPLDVHLMIVNPERYLNAFMDAGADYLTIHVESTRAVEFCLNQIRERGIKAGLSLRPGTPVEALEPYLSLVDIILVMTVEPGWGGQEFRQDQLPKLTWLAKKRVEGQHGYKIQVDGGINLETAKYCDLADSLVSGSYLFQASNRAAAISALKKI